MPALECYEIKIITMIIIIIISLFMASRNSLASFAGTIKNGHKKDLKAHAKKSISAYNRM